MLPNNVDKKIRKLIHFALSRNTGKTVWNLHTRLAEHAKFNNIIATSEHLTTCEHARHITDLHNHYAKVNELRPDNPFTN